MTHAEMVAAIAEAIAVNEGFYKPGAIAKRHRNPGNLRWWGGLPVERGFVVFPSEDAGWEALQHQVRKNIKRGLSLLEFFGGKTGIYPGYAPDEDGNNSTRYAQFVAKRVGIKADLPIVDQIEEA